ncbi:hypothetical protein Tco_0627052 [Tanacetum coccineum]|uniref:Uncharacterized protein n=1 Tax=Tanacetum coccineum TaxID=301880 RepID=A0ABQ4WLE7_9ASTR
MITFPKDDEPQHSPSDDKIQQRLKIDGRSTKKTGMRILEWLLPPEIKATYAFRKIESSELQGEKGGEKMILDTDDDHTVSKGDDRDDDNVDDYSRFLEDHPNSVVSLLRASGAVTPGGYVFRDVLSLQARNLSETSSTGELKDPKDSSHKDIHSSRAGKRDKNLVPPGHSQEMLTSHSKARSGRVDPRC